ncbi:DNA helicase [Brachyspira suanatina]|uniref:DNA helicase n=1 Tax=Brachyspira suanatina TaxID=381802 RepID=A0A0G4K3L0_9SPIR|nr:AAA domain-containing protein [Brachyspira suanatina]CRF31567.1 DNA helicase [Brachyspira suanatina]
MTFLEYLSAWKNYLNVLSDTMIDDKLRIKYLRQIEYIKKIEYGIFMDAKLFQTLKRTYDNNIVSESKKENNIHIDPIQDIYKKGSGVFNIIEKAINSKKLFCLMGPPGTGKTTAIAEIILQTMKMNSKSKIAICSETHIAVDNAIEKLIYECCKRKLNYSIMRYEEFKDKSDNLAYNVCYNNYIDHWKKYVASSYDKKFCENLFFEFERNIGNKKRNHKYICDNVSILGITCNQIGRFKIEETDEAYDLVIIDEVSKNTLPEILMPASFAKKVILVGDPNQLPPVFCRNEIETMNEIDINLQETLIENSLVDRLFKNSDRDTMFGMLDTQYRMEAKIGDIVSRFFYNGELKNATAYCDDESIYWIDYHTNEKFPNNYRGELYNPIEIDLINNSIENLNTNANTSIAIITPYKKQKYEIRKKIKNNENLKHLNIKIDTIDAFQGKEADIVYFSVVRNTGSAKFFSNIKRLNVAISRAKNRLYMVGMSKYCNKVDILKNIYSFSKVC